MKKFIGAALLLFIITPSVALAAWWNPFSWFKKSAPAPQTAATIEEAKTSTSVTPRPGGIDDLVREVKGSEAPRTQKMTSPTSLKKTAPPPSTILSNKKIIAQVKPAVVYIETSEGSGSGMILSQDGYILTNAHVVRGESSATVYLSNGASYNATVTGRDETTDLAVLKVATGGLPTVVLGNSLDVEQGDEVFTLGFPFGIRGDVSFKEGTISRRIEGYFETSAEIHPGNSGGPLVNRYGQVVGINTAIYGKSVSGLQLGETIKLAIPVNTAKDALSELKAGRNIVSNPKSVASRTPQTDQYSPKKSACLAESEQLYRDLVAGVEQQSRNDFEFQNLVIEIDQAIADIKSRRDAQVADITRNYDKYIADTRSSFERLIQGYRTSAMRSGSSATLDSQVASAQAQADEKVAYYESQKRLYVSQAELSASTQIQKYEDLKTKGRSDREKNRQDGLTGAKTKKEQYYQECINK